MNLGVFEKDTKTVVLSDHLLVDKWVVASSGQHLILKQQHNNNWDVYTKILKTAIHIYKGQRALTEGTYCLSVKIIKST